MSDKKTMKELVEEAKALSRTEVDTPTPRPLPGDEFYTPPVTAVTLPSRGWVYTPDSTIYDTGVLEVRAMVATDEDIMTSAGLLRRGKMLSALMRACTVNRTIDADQMLSGDRNALMVAIRNSSYGPEYEASIKCPNCDEENDVMFDLSRLKMKMLDTEPDGGPGNNLFSFTLPVTKREVRFQLLSSAQANELDQILEAQKKAKGPGASEENVTQGLIHQIVDVSGLDRKQIPKFVRSLPVRDSRALRGYIDKISPSLDMEQECECPSCGKRAVVEVPLTAEFFWPKA